MAGWTDRLPACGLYRTTRALPGHEQEVPADVLVYFHNHSDAGLPRVIVPDQVLCNRWRFRGEGIIFRTFSWVESLVRLPEQGYYVLAGTFRFAKGAWPKGALVQLGYTRKGEAMVFIAQRPLRASENHLVFSDRGVRMPDAGLSGLQGPLTVYTDRGDRPADDEPPEHDRQAATRCEANPLGSGRLP